MKYKILVLLGIFMIFTPIITLADAGPVYPYYSLPTYIESAKIVSEGGYIRFCLYNRGFDDKGFEPITKESIKGEIILPEDWRVAEGNLSFILLPETWNNVTLIAPGIYSEKHYKQYYIKVNFTYVGVENYRVVDYSITVVDLNIIYYLNYFYYLISQQNSGAKGSPTSNPIPIDIAIYLGLIFVAIMFLDFILVVIWKKKTKEGGRCVNRK
jgi:hypothetical protein